MVNRAEPLSPEVPAPVAESKLPSAPKGGQPGPSRRLRQPLAPSTFLLRNAGKTLPLIAVIVLAVMLVVGIIALIDSIPLSIRTIYKYTQESIGLSPRGDNSHMPELLATVKTEAPVPIEKIVMCRASSSQVQSIVGKWPFIVLGLDSKDIEYYLHRQHSTGLTGRIPHVGAPEAIISDPVAKNLHLSIGSVLQGPDLNESYSQLKVKVVGIAHTDRWIMLNSIEYQRLYHFPPIDLAMIFAATPSDQQVLDRWAEKRFKGERAQIYTYSQIEKNTQEMFRTLFAILNVVIGMLVLVITLMMGMLINIYQSQRLVEFGLLQAIGYTKRQLIHRALMENLLVVIFGWIFGIIAAHGLLLILSKILMEPRAFALDSFDLMAFKYSIPIPVTILMVAVGTVLWRFRKFDPVAVVERRLV